MLFTICIAAKVCIMLGSYWPTSIGRVFIYRYVPMYLLLLYDYYSFFLCLRLCVFVILLFRTLNCNSFLLKYIEPWARKIYAADE